MPNRVLAIDNGSGAFRFLSGLLSRGLVTVIDSAAEAPARLRAEPSRLVVAAYPLPDMELSVFVRSMRQGLPDALQPFLLFVSRHRDLKDFAGYGDEQMEVISLSQPPDELRNAVAYFMGMPPRLQYREHVTVVTRSKGERLSFEGSTQNVSVEGILISCERALPIGTIVALGFDLPNGEIRARAEVMRHANAETEEVFGLGMRFLAFDRDGARLIEDFLAQQAEKEVTGQWGFELPEIPPG